MSIHDDWPAEYLVVVDRACSQCEGTGVSVLLPGRRCMACGGHGRAMLPLESALQVLYDRGLWPRRLPGMEPGETLDSKSSEESE